MNLRLSAALLCGALALTACSSSSPTAPSSGTSSTTGGAAGLSSSHNAGRDCSSCHSWTVAGTAYKSDGTTVYPGAVIRITTAAAGGGTVVMTLTSDASGNFYTSTPITFGAGLYPTATGTTGTARSMTAAITSGACNRCHVAGTRIVVG